jgi:hypothetical protein
MFLLRVCYLGYLHWLRVLSKPCRPVCSMRFFLLPRTCIHISICRLLIALHVFTHDYMPGHSNKSVHNVQSCTLHANAALSRVHVSQESADKNP